MMSVKAPNTTEKRRRVVIQQYRHPEKLLAEKRGRLTDGDTKGVKRKAAAERG